MRANICAQLVQLCARNKDGSHLTQANRRAMLEQMGKTLQKAGFRDMAATSLKPKHVETLIQTWKREGLSAATQKNRMAAVRWWAEKVGKQNVVPKTNDLAKIERRAFVAKETKAQHLSQEQLSQVKNERIRTSLELQQAFGLRREEALKFSPSYADKGDRVILKGSWCKGGRAREIPVRTEAQRELLNKVATLAGKGSMIPADKSYKEWRHTYEKTVSRANLKNMHGLRHDYAQRRFEELAGFKSPVAGGPSRADLTPAQREIDYMARMQVSLELGHGREDVTAVYLGR